MDGRFTKNSQSAKIHFFQSLLQNSILFTYITQIVIQFYILNACQSYPVYVLKCELSQGVFPNLLFTFSRLGVY